MRALRLLTLAALVGFCSWLVALPARATLAVLAFRLLLLNLLKLLFFEYVCAVGKCSEGFCLLSFGFVCGGGLVRQIAETNFIQEVFRQF